MSQPVFKFSADFPPFSRSRVRVCVYSENAVHSFLREEEKPKKIATFVVGASRVAPLLFSTLVVGRSCEKRDLS